jgi:hypothetical protein
MTSTIPRIRLPALHPGQMPIHDHPARYRVLRCGRRFGKTIYGQVEASLTALNGDPVGWFAPSYKYLLEPWRDLNKWLAPVIEKSNSQEMRIDLTTGGVIDFWTMETPDPGRSRKYKLVIPDECGIVRNLLSIWREAIRPTLTDLKGRALFLGTPKGRREFHQLFQKGEQGDANWKSFTGRTIDNPAIDPNEVHDAEREYRAMGLEHIFRQEYEGIPADDGGNPFGMKAIEQCFGPLSNDLPEFFGIDLAKSMDWTWVIGLDRKRRVCVSERWQADWEATKRRLKIIVGSVPAMVDATGVGDPIVESMQKDLPHVEGFKFSATSKQQLMEGLALALQTKSIQVADDALRIELETFEYEYTRTGVRYAAPQGLHDDGVCALALAVRAADSRPADGFAFRVLG